MKKINKKYIFWSIFLIAFASFFYATIHAIKPFFISFVIAYLLHPIIDKLQKKGISRSFSSVVIVLLSFTIIIGTISIVIPFVYEKITEFINEIFIDKDGMTNLAVSKISSALNINQDLVTKIINYISTNISSGLTAMGKFDSSNILTTIISIIAIIFVMPIITFYMLKDLHSISRSFYNLIPNHNRQTVEYIVNQIDKSIFSFLRGQVSVCIFFIIFYSISLYFTGLNFGFLLGILVGILIFVPYIGFFIGSVICIIVSFMQFGADSNTMIIGLIFISGQLIDANYTTPKFVGTKVGIHPVWIVFGLFVCSAIFGTIGAILAPPITASMSILARYCIQRYKNSHFYTNE